MAESNDDRNLNFKYNQHIINSSQENLWPRIIVGFGILLYFFYADIYLRESILNAQTRVVPILVLIVLFVFQLINFKNKAFYYHTYNVFLVSLVIMMYIMDYRNMYKEYLPSTITGTVLVIFILAYDFKSSLSWTIVVFFLPFLGFLYSVINYLSIDKNQFILISNFFPMLILGFTINIINYRTNFKSFVSNYKLREEQVKVEELHSITKVQNEELTAQNEKIYEQKNFLEDQQKEIQDSIEYARRIQSTYLPEEEFFNKLFPEHFIVNIPKDIVSGDFYWAVNTPESDFIAAIDCTGHGVPGAFLTFVATNILNKAVYELDLKSTSKILAFLNDEIYRTFRHRSSKALKVGMDIIVLRFDKERKYVKFSGAYHSLIHIRNRELNFYRTDLIEIGSDKIANREFNKKSIELEAGDLIYIYSDGYADQMGGMKDRRFMSRRFKEALQEVSNLDMKLQKRQLIAIHERWRGLMFQTDDILVIGIKV